METVTWEYYNSHFPKLSEGEFKKLEYRASRRVLKKIVKKNLSTQEETDVMDCICNVINLLSVIESQAGKSSVSNDGYSESYASMEQLENSVNGVIQEWIGKLTDIFVGF